MPKNKSNIEIKNKRAGFEYEFLEKYTAGIVLSGTEIKSIRAGKASLADKELRKLQRAVKEKGLTIVATRLFIAENGYAKLNIALARGKKEYDKRESIKEKDLKRAMERF